MIKYGFFSPFFAGLLCGPMVGEPLLQSSIRRHSRELHGPNKTFTLAIRNEKRGLAPDFVRHWIAINRVQGGRMDEGERKEVFAVLDTKD